MKTISKKIKKLKHKRYHKALLPGKRRKFKIQNSGFMKALFWAGIILLHFFIILFSLDILINYNRLPDNLTFPIKTKIKTFTVPSIALTPTVEPIKKTDKNNIVISENLNCVFAPVIMYHHIKPLIDAQREHQENLSVDPLYFEQHINYLIEKGYDFMSAEELAQDLKNNINLPEKPIIITMDDGYDDIYKYAYPIIKKYNVKTSLMIPTGLLEIKGYLTWDNLKEMVDFGPVFAYNHTWSHFPLITGDKEKYEMEIVTAKNQLEQVLGRTVNIFAYPYGSYNKVILETLRNNGFLAAFTTNQSFYQCRNSLYELNRVRVGNAPLSSYGFN